MDKKIIISKVLHKISLSRSVEEAKETSSPDLLDELSKDSLWKVRAEVALNKHSDLNTLLELAKAEDTPKVLMNMLKNKNLDEDILIVIAKNETCEKNFSIYHSICEHPKATATVYKLLMRLADKKGNSGSKKDEEWEYVWESANNKLN